jgi:cytochrome c-type biogenesis protein CcmH
MRHHTAMLLVLFILGVALPLQAQRIVTEDDVSAVAEQMYCPVCENIPLDDCGTPTCNQWKDEIYQQLVEGRNPQAIIDDFVARYGQHVVGIPQDPTLRLLSFIMPIFGVVLALGLGFLTFTRWQKGQDAPIATVAETSTTQDNQNYRAMIERDLG